MSVDDKTVRRVAKLARLALPEERVAPMAGELNRILQWVEQLNEVDVASAPPLTSVVEADLKRRPDRVTDGGYADDLMKNAPQSEDHYFVVPKVVE